jgi:sugar lactone lactonase YvrE
MKHTYLTFILTIYLVSCSTEDPIKKTSVIESLNPSSGKYNTEVTITGSNFDPSATPFKVTFNGVQAEIISANKKQIIVKVPKGAKTGKVALETTLGIIEGPEFEYVYTITVSTIAGSTQGFEDGASTSAKFDSPVATVIDQNGNILVADRFNHRIRKISPAGQVSTFAGTGVSGSLDGDLSTAQFSGPNYMVYDSEGNLYVSELTRIRKITPLGQVSVFAGGSTQGFADGTGIDARFNIPTGMVFDSKGDLIVMDRANNRIRKISSGGIVSTFIGDGTAASLDGTGTTAQINGPWGVAIDNLDNLYVTEFAGFKIRKVNSAGQLTTITGTTAGFQDGEVSIAMFNQVYGISLDNESNLYIADGGHRIRKISNFNMVTTLVGNGQPGFADGDESSARLNLPYSVTIQGNHLIVAERLNFKIRKLLME